MRPFDVSTAATYCYNVSGKYGMNKTFGQIIVYTSPSNKTIKTVLKRFSLIVKLIQRIRGFLK